jgi:iron(III) transport system permease protein
VTQLKPTGVPESDRQPAAPGRSDLPSGRRTIDWSRVFTTKHIILAVVVLTITYLAVVPLGYLLWGTFWDGRNLTVDPFERAYTTTGLGALVWNSLWFAFGATLVSVVIGTGLAYLTERTDIPFKKLIFIASLVPLIIPGILYTISWIFLGSPRIGIFNQWLEPIFGPGFLNIFSLPGMVIVQ